MQKTTLNFHRGFTLIEVLIVVLVIGLLAAIAIPVFNGQRQKAKDAKTISALMNSEKAIKSVWLDKEKYTSTSVDEASNNEKGLRIVAASPVTYKKTEVLADTPDTRTMVAVQKSDSGRDFCIVSKSDGPNAGVYRSWEISDQAVLQTLGCPPSAQLALGGKVIALSPESPADSVNGGSSSTNPPSGAPATGQTPSTGGSSTPPVQNFGNYISVRNSLGTDATCPLDEVGGDYLNMVCTGGVGGQLKDRVKPTSGSGSWDYQLQQPGALFTTDVSGTVSNDPTNASVYFNGQNNHGSYINNNGRMLMAGSGGSNRDWSTEIWVKPEQAGASEGIVGDESMFAFAMTGSGFQGGVRQTGGSWAFRTVSANMAVNSNKWYHLVMTWSNGSLKLYVNGILKDTVSGIGNLNTGGNNIQLGWAQGYANTRWKGWLDEFSFYGKALTADNVKALYEAGSQSTAK